MAGAVLIPASQVPQVPQVPHSTLFNDCTNRKKCNSLARANMPHSKDKRQSYSSMASIDEVQELLANLADMNISSCTTHTTKVSNGVSEIDVVVPPTVDLYTSTPSLLSTPDSGEQSKGSVNENEVRDPFSEAPLMSPPAPSSVAKFNPIKPEIKIKIELAPLAKWAEVTPFTFETLQTPHSPPEMPTSTFADRLERALLEVSSAHTHCRNMDRCGRGRPRPRGRSGTRKDEMLLGASEVKLRHEARERSRLSRCKACYAIGEGSEDPNVDDYHLSSCPAHSPDYPSPFGIQFYRRTEAKAAPLGLYKQLPSLPVGYYVNSSQDSLSAPTN